MSTRLTLTPEAMAVLQAAVLEATAIIRESLAELEGALSNPNDEILISTRDHIAALEVIAKGLDAAESVEFVMPLEPKHLEWDAATLKRLLEWIWKDAE